MTHQGTSHDAGSEPSAGGQPPARQPFSLLPFGAGDASLAGTCVEGWVERHGERLTLEFQLSCHAEHGEDAILWPAAVTPPQRCDGLWEHTCFEWFVARPQQDAYWEFNLCPNGNWNVYALDGYRRGLKPDPLYTALPLVASNGGEGSRFRVNTALPAPLASAQHRDLELAVTAALERRSGAISYWALHHGGAAADFHRRDGFQLRI